MREHVFSEVDKDKDFLISLDEFILGTQGENYEKDEGWKPLDEEEVCPLMVLQAFYFLCRPSIISFRLSVS